MDQVTTRDAILHLLRKVDRPGMEGLIEYLEDSNFFTSPASRNYHNAFDGGLADHSLNVYKLFNRKCKEWQIPIPEDSIIVSALLHDFCKIGVYNKEMRWKKDESTGNKWEQYETYGYAEEYHPWGHGEKSVIELQRFIKLADREIALIRWHMGFSEPQQNYMHLNKAIKKYPEICLIHGADLEASHILEAK